MAIKGGQRVLNEKQKPFATHNPIFITRLKLIPNIRTNATEFGHKWNASWAEVGMGNIYLDAVGYEDRIICYKYTIYYAICVT